MAAARSSFFLLMPGLYLHVPFCVRRCVYCDFYLETLGTGPLPHRLSAIESYDHSAYLAGIEKELAGLPADFVPNTVYIGGGTPTELGTTALHRLLSAIHANVDGSRIGEFTCEANPGTLIPEKIDLLLAHGINRLSLGVQSFQPDALEYLSRIHTREEAFTSFRVARDKGFQNISLDLMFGVPHTHAGHIEQDLDAVLALQPDHVSWYLLDYIEGTSLTGMRDSGHLREIDEDVLCAQYEKIRHALVDSGYEHYEIFNYARPGFQSAHNAAYWVGGEYFGVGPSAHSHWNGTRWHNVAHTGNYLRLLSEGRDARRGIETLAPAAKARELAMTTLRRIGGVDLDWFLAHSGFDLLQLGGSPLQDMIAEGWFVQSPSRLALHPNAYLVANSLLANLME